MVNYEVMIQSLKYYACIGEKKTKNIRCTNSGTRYIVRMYHSSRIE